jgi:hypothetical protein
VNALDFPQCPVIAIDASQPYAEVSLAARRAIWLALTDKAQ